MLTVSQAMTLHGLVATKNRASVSAQNYSEQEAIDYQELQRLRDEEWLAGSNLDSYIDSLVEPTLLVGAK